MRHSKLPMEGSQTCNKCRRRCRVIIQCIVTLSPPACPVPIGGHTAVRLPFLPHITSLPHGTNSGVMIHLSVVVTFLVRKNASPPNQMMHGKHGYQAEQEQILSSESSSFPSSPCGWHRSYWTWRSEERQARGMIGGNTINQYQAMCGYFFFLGNWPGLGSQ